MLVLPWLDSRTHLPGKRFGVGVVEQWSTALVLPRYVGRLDTSSPRVS
jgi:hypothetical protein